MKKFLCMLIVINLVLGMFGYVQAADEGTSSKIVCNLNNAPIVINGKPVNIRTITYQNRVYVPVNEISGYLKASIRVDESKKSVSITTTGTPAKLESAKRKYAKMLKKSIYVGLNQYKILVDSLDAHMESISYDKTIYVPIRYFSEIFNKQVEPKADGRILISDKTGIVSIVNGEKIYRWEFDYYYNTAVKRIESTEGIDVEKEKEALKQNVLSYITDDKILLQKVKEAKLSLDSIDISEINSAIDGFIADNGGIQNFRKSLSEYGLYLHHVIAKYKEGYITNKLLKKLVDTVTATDDELNKYYEENKEKFIDLERVRAKHILLLTRDEAGNSFDLQKKNEVKAKAEDILNKIKNGGNFDDLMNSNSEDPGLKSNPDGYIFSKGQMVKEFEDAAFVLNVGEVSGLVETAYGYHIIKLEEKTPSRIRSFEEVKESIKRELDNQKKQEYVNQLMDKWKKESKIENKI